MTEESPYEDIIHLPHFVSKRHKKMPPAQRAAQFAPFAALTGYESSIKETTRKHCDKSDTSTHAEQQ